MRGDLSSLQLLEIINNTIFVVVEDDKKRVFILDIMKKLLTKRVMQQ